MSHEEPCLLHRTSKSSPKLPKRFEIPSDSASSYIGLAIFMPSLHMSIRMLKQSHLSLDAAG